MRASMKTSAFSLKAAATSCPTTNKIVSFDIDRATTVTYAMPVDSLAFADLPMELVRDGQTTETCACLVDEYTHEPEYNLTTAI